MGDQTIIIGAYNPNFKMASREILEEKICEVRERGAKFNISCGPLLWQGKPLEKTYVLEIHYYDSLEDHSKHLLLGGWASMLSDSYAIQAHKLVKEFCEKKHLIINQHLNSYPEYQAIVTIPDNLN